MAEQTIEALQSNFTGDIIKPGDSQYDQARATYLFKGTPALIARPRTASDVVQAVKYARDNKLLLSVRSGGHSGSGFSTNDGGVVIDLMHMNSVEVLDTQTHRVRIGGGALWGDIAIALQKHGLTLSSGDTKTVGVGGLTLGAGMGWMIRKYGLAIDSLVAAEVITADGAIRRASADEHSDLFWAIRGGGGNFGVGTSFEFIAHPMGKVYAGTIAYGVDDVAGVLKGWRDYMRQAPEELTTTLLIMPEFGGNPPAVIIMCCYASDDKGAAMQAVGPLQQLGKVVRQDIAEKDYADVLEEAHPPQGFKIITNNMFVRKFSDDLIETINKQKGHMLQIRSCGGAMNRVAAAATAFAHRDSEAFMVMPAFVAPDASAADIDVALAGWRAIEHYGNGAYINFFTELTGAEVPAAYPTATYERLAKIKQTYDPQNIFNQNYNITPHV
ncbi:MAG TPA: FAD-binding oxidoreductase [Candidatus Saccharimonadales bacterium]|jgi:FAD/FMN-containing dehydrogenase|nr:FAD-binding oxidoreductase [Candidatus Saccharimonadales bacterium]